MGNSLEVNKFCSCNYYSNNRIISNNNEVPNHNHPIERQLAKSSLINSSSNKEFLEQTFTEIPETIIKYPDGSEYIGQTVNGSRYGKGILKGKNKEILYEGNWINDYQQGEGKQFLDNNLIYIGEFFEGIRTGRGKIISTDENNYRYEGNFLNGEKHGYGEEILHDTKYMGDFFEGKRHGIGKYVIQNGIYYEGQFVDDKINGKVYLH